MNRDITKDDFLSFMNRDMNKGDFLSYSKTPLNLIMDAVEIQNFISAFYSFNAELLEKEMKFFHVYHSSQIDYMRDEKAKMNLIKQIEKQNVSQSFINYLRSDEIYEGLDEFFKVYEYKLDKNVYYLKILAKGFFQIFLFHCSREERVMRKIADFFKPHTSNIFTIIREAEIENEKKFQATEDQVFKMINHLYDQSMEINFKNVVDFEDILKKYLPLYIKFFKDSRLYFLNNHNCDCKIHAIDFVKDFAYIHNPICFYETDGEYIFEFKKDKDECKKVIFLIKNKLFACWKQRRLLLDFSNDRKSLIILFGELLFEKPHGIITTYLAPFPERDYSCCKNVEYLSCNYKINQPLFFDIFY